MQTLTHLLTYDLHWLLCSVSPSAFPVVILPSVFKKKKKQLFFPPYLGPDIPSYLLHISLLLFVSPESSASPINNLLTFKQVPVCPVLPVYKSPPLALASIIAGYVESTST